MGTCCQHHPNKLKQKHYWFLSLYVMPVFLGLSLAGPDKGALSSPQSRVSERHHTGAQSLTSPGLSSRCPLGGTPSLEWGLQGALKGKAWGPSFKDWTPLVSWACDMLHRPQGRPLSLEIGGKVAPKC